MKPRDLLYIPLAVSAVALFAGTLRARAVAADLVVRWLCGRPA